MLTSESSTENFSKDILPTRLTHGREMKVLITKQMLHTAWKVSVIGVFLVCIFLHSDRIRRDIHTFPY